MRTHTGHERRQVNVDVNVEDAAAGWPLGRHGRHSAWSEGPRTSRAGNSVDHVGERSFEALAHEVEELIQRQPQFAFLKPCRQLEKHYASRRNSSFRHGAPEARAVSSARVDSRTLFAAESDHVGAKQRGESRRKLEEDATAKHCWLRDGDAMPGSRATIRELLSTDGGGGSGRDLHVRVRHHHDAASAVPSSDHSSSSAARSQSSSAAAQCALARILSRNGIELNSFVEAKPDSQGGTSERVTRAETSLRALPRRSVSERFAGRGQFHRDYEERIWRISSTRCSIHEKEAHIDLVAPAATKFLVEASGSPMCAAARRCNDSPPAVAVPFEWEDAPGRAKFETAALKPDPLQLPPRLVGPVQRGGESFSRDLRVSVVAHPLAGFFPCMTASSLSRPPPHDPTWAHARKVSRQAVPKSAARKLNKSFSQPLASTDQSPNAKPRRLFSSELKAEYGAGPPSDPTSILHSSRQSSSSRTYLSCELDASTPRTVGSKSSSSASYESVGEDFDHDESVSPSSATAKAHPFDAEAPSFAPPTLGASQGRRAHSHRSEGVRGLLKLCKSHGACLGKAKSRPQRLGPLCSPEVWAPTLATYFQRLDVNEPAVSSSLLQGAPTSSSYLNEPVPSEQFASPERPTRLPYKMPSVAEQERAARHPHRDPKPSSMDLCPSPAYTAALEMLSPAVNLMASRRHGSARNPAWPGSPKPHRRVQFILSVCKTLKRVLFRQQPRRSVIGTRLMYYDERAPTTFQFSKPN